VATLVDEAKQSGEYQVEWNVEGFTSSIYLYQLRAGSFADTKKLLLLR
jgi:hypothetical protein